MTELIGYREHGIKRLEDFTSEKARQEARTRWLTDKEYLAIVANPHRYTGLLAGDLRHLNAISIVTGQQDNVLFLCNKNLRDGLDLLMSETEDVLVKRTRYMTLTRSFDHLVERREYVLNAYGDLKLVHYGKNTRPERMHTRAAAVMRATRVVADILVHYYKKASTEKKEEEDILRSIKDDDRSSGSGGAAA